MIHITSKNRPESRILLILFLITFVIHLVLTIYASTDGAITFIAELQEDITKAYQGVGFEWRGVGAYVVTAALISSCLTNTVRRFFEGIFLGWPRFKKHDKYSLLQAMISLVGYTILMYFTIGFFGEKFSSKNIDSINIILIATSTYIAGLLVDLVDDFISGLFLIHFGDNK